ncbi:nitroreductase family protein [Photorhabdus bodei]|uniref:Nitroreductase domain-containing protein n=1 Tax=Photorhabdus bodei TaxID=2029681 RepID=A0ABX0ATV7_9GAMM|nr:hypothetical protein [Photorhabdus bodei]NDL05619.1 hypothetical protein [Photorhabdus bodei]NDL09812.1 hypothetical protein [Photorhabdus bodei]
MTIGQEQKNGLLRCYIHAQKGEGQSPDDAARKSLAAKLNCSPNIVICIFSPKKHIKVPESEQLLSMGAAIQNMIVTSCLLGGSAFWATGDLAYTQGFKDILGLEQQERIVGILHLGKSPHKTIPKERPNVDLFFKRLEA